MAHGRDLHHCPACAFAHKQEDAVLRHCREQHAAEGKLYPYTLACAHGVQQCGPSCALASVLAVVSHFPEEATFSRELRDTYAAPSRAATAHIVEACGLQLPVGPATALEEVVAREPVLRSSFRTGTWRSGSAPCVERPRCCTARAATSRQCPEAWWRCCRHSARQSTWTLMRSWRA
ncbi:hypothetical protein ERJ75_001282300 [Trypanosoma vivax]|nr:hypothetical protein ERJ75_001282300 [Trypanosoma vivax]